MAKILLVEDDTILVEMYQAKFELEGHDVRVATNGEECLAILKDYVPELILLDILMPKLNGFHVLKEIKKQPNLRQIPIILLTNLGQAEVDMNQELAKALGVNDYLIKSHHTPDEVVNKVVKVLGTSGRSQSAAEK
ncbi:MAG TPA: response regulator [Candidatus Saccharimonadia bacterium]|jgi:two-component system alkaline phosphatase synthesis response regulator PhoP|nr:response regulator [Candidatus Saccharimonadia bacterium]